MAEDASGKVTFNFDMIKSNFFRVIHADGAWGGSTPRGLLSFAFYSERGAIPRRTALELSASGPMFVATGPETIVDGRDAIVREVEVEVIMDIDAAVTFHKWLGDKIKEREDALK